MVSSDARSAAGAARTAAKQAGARANAGFDRGGRIIPWTHTGMWSRPVDSAAEADGLVRGRAVCAAGTDASTGKVRDAHERRGVGSGRVL